MCDTECSDGCKGPLNTDCITDNLINGPQFIGCKNRLFQRADLTYECLAECPTGYYDATDGDGIDTCNACHEACTECENFDTSLQILHTDLNPDNYPVGYQECCGKQCAKGFYVVDAGIGKIQCLERCPDGYFPIVAERRCVEKWAIIAFQDRALDSQEKSFDIKSSHKIIFI